MSDLPLNEKPHCADYGIWLPCDIVRGPSSFASHPFEWFAFVQTLLFVRFLLQDGLSCQQQKHRGTHHQQPLCGRCEFNVDQLFAAFKEKFHIFLLFIFPCQIHKN